MAQYVYTMNRVGKVVPPKKTILQDISLSFFPGAKIGVLGLNGSGKSTLLRIMAGLDSDILGEARPQPGIKIGYLPQEPHLNPDKNVRGNVEEGVQEAINALERFLDGLFGATGFRDVPKAPDPSHNPLTDPLRPGIAFHDASVPKEKGFETLVGRMFVQLANTILEGHRVDQLR